MKRKGTIDEYIKTREELRNNIGQITFVYASKTITPNGVKFEK